MVLAVEYSVSLLLKIEKPSTHVSVEFGAASRAVYCRLATCHCLLLDMHMVVVRLRTQRSAVRLPGRCVALGFTCSSSGMQLRQQQQAEVLSADTGNQLMKRSRQLQLLI